MNNIEKLFINSNTDYPKFILKINELVDAVTDLQEEVKYHSNVIAEYQGKKPVIDLDKPPHGMNRQDEVIHAIEAAKEQGGER